MEYSDSICVAYNFRGHPNPSFDQQNISIEYFPTYALRAIRVELVDQNNPKQPYYCTIHSFSGEREPPGEKEDLV